MEPSIGGIKRKRGAKYSDFGPIEGYISETMPDTRQVSMSFRLLPKSVTLNDLRRCNYGPYFASFHWIRVWCRRKTITSVSKSTFDSLWPY